MKCPQVVQIMLLIVAICYDLLVALISWNSTETDILKHLIGLLRLSEICTNPSHSVAFILGWLKDKVLPMYAWNYVHIH